MTVIAGKVTFGSTGSKTVNLGMAPNDIMFLPDGYDVVGYADHSYQFSRQGGYPTDRTQAVVVKDSSGVVQLAFTVTGWSASGFTANVSVANANIPFDLIARS